MTGSYLKLRGRKVRIDARGFVSLSDIYNLAGEPKGRSPYSWSVLTPTKAFVLAAYDRVGVDRGDGIRISDVLQIAADDKGGTWAHPIVAASYAGFLNPKLEVEINEVWLRYKSGDETLVDEVRQNAKRQPDRWNEVRKLGRDRRKDFTASLADHGVQDGKDYAKCTNATYRSLFGAPASSLKIQRGVPARGRLRDAMTTSELSYLAAAETLSAERIEDENPHGSDACAKATRRSSDRIRDAIMADRADRAKSLFRGGDDNA